jgi:hypothetical protein
MILMQGCQWGNSEAFDTTLKQTTKSIAMTTNLSARFLAKSKWFIGLFALLFIFRIAYGYMAKDTTTSGDFSDNFFGSIDNLRKNYASEKYQIKGDVQAASNVASNQKFEKTASIKSQTSDFDNDEKRIKAQTKAFKAVIQYEQNLGQPGSRQIHLLIGVNPELFDSFYVEIKKIGVLIGVEVTKVDKTNEYKQLNAKKISIEKTLQSLNELKSKGGQITDFVALNDKILEIEEKLQELGVELGNFDAENEFCTVKLSVYESAAERKISLIHRIKVALQWAIKYYAILVFATLGLALTVFVVLLVLDRLNGMKQ